MGWHKYWEDNNEIIEDRKYMRGSYDYIIAPRITPTDDSGKSNVSANTNQGGGKFGRKNGVYGKNIV